VSRYIASNNESGRSKFWFSLVLLTLFTVLTFSNSAHDALVFDDRGFLGPGADYKIESLTEAFTRGVWDSKAGLYRPLLKIDFELQNRLFGAWLEGYHLANILLHLVTTLTLFGFVRYLLRTRQPGARHLDLYALLTALIFAVHPVHTEVVNSVFNKSSMYVSLAAIGGLWWLLSNIERSSARAWVGFGLVYCVAILFKESALVLPGIAVAMIVLFTDGDLKVRIRRFLPVFWLLVPIAAYFGARAIALAGGDPATGSDEVASILHITQNVGDRPLINIIAKLGEGLKVLAWPYPLRLFYSAPGEAAVATYIGIQVLLGGWAVYLLARGRPVLAFALVFYYLSLLTSIRLFDLDGAIPHLSERYLYFPSVGLALALAFGFRALAARFGRKYLLLIMLPVILALAAISWDRNADWISQVQLFESEYQSGSRSHHNLNKLITAHFDNDHFERVVRICDDNKVQFEENYNFVNTCAVSYIKQKRTDAAIAALDVYARNGEEWISARLQLAALHLMLRKQQEAVGQYAAIIDGVEDPATKELYKGEMLLAVFPDDREQLELARRVFQQAIALNPHLDAAQGRIKQIDEILGETDLPSEPGDSK
jgi:tetratricopeptide (TPR) repeat protein